MIYAESTKQIEHIAFNQLKALSTPKEQRTQIIDLKPETPLHKIMAALRLR